MADEKYKGETLNQFFARTKIEISPLASPRCRSVGSEYAETLRVSRGDESILVPARNRVYLPVGESDDMQFWSFYAFYPDWHKAISPEHLKKFVDVILGGDKTTIRRFKSHFQLPV